MSNASNALVAAGMASGEHMPAHPGDVPSGFRLKKRVTNTLLKMAEGVPYVVRFDGAIYKAPRENDAGKPASASGEAQPKKEPPHLALITWYPEHSGEGLPHVLIIPAVLRGELSKAYPGDSYVGRTFCLIKHAIQGKAYKGFEIAELEPETAPADKADDQMPRRRKS